MENQVKVFESAEFGSVRTVEVNGVPYFVGRDVATILGYKNIPDAISKHVDEEDKGVAKCDTLGGTQEMVVINESGLYSLVFGSKLPNAKKFTKWVTSEVLPSIRKTGSYNVPQMSVNELIFEMAKSNLETEKRLKSLEESVSKTSDKLETALNIFTAPSCEVSWKDNVRATVSKMCENSGKCWSVIYGEMYTELEIEAGCNLSARVRKAQERMEKQGYTYKQRKAYRKLDAVADDKKLRAIFEGIIKKYQVRYLQGDNVQEYI